MQQGNLNVNWNTNSSFLVYIQNDDIFSYDGQKIGVVNKKYNDVEQGLIKCKEKLIELGVIKVPKTQEEIIKEQSEMIEKQNQAINQMLARIEELSHEYRTTKGNNELSTGELKRESDTSIEQGIGDNRPNADKNKRGRSKSVSTDK